MAALRMAGVEPESYLPEYGPRQYEVTCAPALGVTAADRAVVVREIARATARCFGHHLSFSPTVTPDVVGNGVHIHMSLLDREGRPVTYDSNAPHGLSVPAGRFVAGILHHARALCALTAPSVVSYLRLIPHRWSAAWSNLGYRDREACVRICPVDETPSAQIANQFNIEFRAADATASPYIALGAMVRAGLDGLKQNLPTPEVTVVDPGTLGDDERARYRIARLPQSLDEALKALVDDPTAKSWLSEALFDAYLRHKRCELGLMAELDQAARCSRYKEAY
jgi:glutamine synthetase